MVISLATWAMPCRGKIGAADQTAHAVADQNDLLGAGGFADLVDSLYQLGNEFADTGVGRNQADTGHRVACRFKIAPDFPPDTPAAAIAVDQNYRLF